MLKEDTAGHFEIRGPLGRGGMAMVYLATETALGRKVAIKVLPPELTFGHGVERFKREAKTAAALDHPHIIPVYRVATGGKLFWYAMKFLEGRSLDDMLKERERLPLEESVSILEQVADALDYAHEHHVVHRDIKPANVMLDSRNRVIVTDFGIAKALTEGNLTASGSVIGTPFFMSPEQGMGKPVSGKSDQYSVAVMAYRMLSGHVPFDGDSAIDILHKHCMTPPPPLDVLAYGLPPHVAWAVNKALEKNPDKRFPSVKAFIEAIKRPSAESELSTQATVMQGEAVTPESMKAAAATRTGPSQRKGAPPKSMERMSTQLMNTGDLEKKRKKGSGKMVGLLVGVAILGGGGAWAAMQTGILGAKPAAKPPVDSATVGGQVAAVTPPVVPADTTRSVAPPPVAPPTRREEPRVQRQTPQRPVDRQPATNPQRQPTTTATQQPVAPAVPAGPQRGEVQIQVVGGWYEISIDGVSKGQKNVLRDSLTLGEHLIQFKRDGYVSLEETVRVTADAPARVRVTLRQS